MISRSVFPVISSLASLMVSGCTTTVGAPPMQDSESNCPVLASDGWQAVVSPLAGDNQRSQLSVTGKVTMPTPGYTFAWEAGRLDRSAIPAFELHLQTRAPDGMVVQVLETREVTFIGPAAAPRYRAITIMCAGKELARIENVS